MLFLRRKLNKILYIRQFSSKVHDTTEYFDEPNVIEEKCKLLTENLLKSKETVVFTGAGISTYSGIPDFRSGFNTILPTGPGKWETPENKAKWGKEQKIVPAVKAIPSKTHMAIKMLVDKGYISHIVTQNVDGLHRKSGISEEKISELHGTINKEICSNCKTVFIRDFNVRNYENSEKEHKTLRKCEYCYSDLNDTIVYFGEPLPKDIFEVAKNKCNTGDFCLVLGSSLKVSPASWLPRYFIDREKPLAIVNLQKTHMDRQALIRIGSLTDHILEKVLKNLKIEIPEFSLIKTVGIKIDQGIKSSVLKIRSYNQQGVEVTDMKSVEIILNADKSHETAEKDGRSCEYEFFGNLHFLEINIKTFENHTDKVIRISQNELQQKWDHLIQGDEIFLEFKFDFSVNEWKHISK